MAAKKIDTRAIGLDTALALSRWLTGKEHLHYGLWTGLDIAAGNVGAAQEAYSARLFALLPQRPGLRILDIGGGAGETAKKLIALGHQVEIVVPSAYLASRCRINAPEAVVHECVFQDLQSAGGFDLCFFSESFQYIPLPLSLQKARSLLAPSGEILIGDCFRSESFHKDPVKHTVGGGHPIAKFRRALAAEPLRIVAEEDITEAVAPSIDLEQALFNVVGVGLTGIEAQLKAHRPTQHWLIRRAINLLMNARKRARLSERLFERERNSQSFIANNRYLLIRLSQAQNT
jgi:SAM-dependent methyltransferase